MNFVDLSDEIVGAQILSLDFEEGAEVYKLVLSNGRVLFLVGGLGLMRVETERLH